MSHRSQDGSASGVGQAGMPGESPRPAPIVTELAAGRSLRCVWTNPLGGQTWQIDQAGTPVEYVKVGPPNVEFDPDGDQARFGWVARYVPAPEVLDRGVVDAGRPGELVWLRTLALPGRTAISHDFDVPDERIIHALGQALRQLHDTLPVAECPWTWSVADRLALVPTDDPLHRRPAPDLDPVVAHGDACNPNFLFADDGTFVGYVDLGRIGVADRWADLAPALMSLGWNFGDGHQETFLRGYGIDLDPHKLDYYSALWNGESVSGSGAADGAGSGQ